MAAGAHAGGDKEIKDPDTKPLDKVLEGTDLNPPFLNLNLNRADLPPLPDKYDLTEFIREQAEFIKAQTRFLGLATAGTSANNTEYGIALTGYSHAQTRYIWALTRVLEQVRAI